MVAEWLAAGVIEQGRFGTGWLAGWLAPRGLAFNKTHIVHVERGFDFLGFNGRRYGSKLLIKPSQAAARRIRQRLAAEVRSLHGGNAIAVIRRLNPIIRGWAAYYRSVVSKEVFSTIDDYLWGRLCRWALCAHPNKSKHWVVDRYFAMFKPSRNHRWVFGDCESGIYLRQFAWTRIVRHKMVVGTASPDDPALDWYWASRRRKVHAQIGGRTARCCFGSGDLAPPAERSCWTPPTVRNPHVSGSSGPGS